MIFSAQRHSTRHVWRLPRPPVSPVPHTKSHVTCVSAHAQQNQKKPNTAPRGARRGASICTGDQTIESSVVGCVEHDVERVCPVRWQCQREKIEEELERERNRKRRPKCENGKISALLRLLPTTPHTARQSGQRRGPYPYLQLNAWAKEPMRTKQSAPDWTLDSPHGTRKVPCQIPFLLSLLAAVSVCPELPNAVMTRLGSDAENFLAVRIAPLPSSLIHIYSM